MGKPRGRPPLDKNREKCTWDEKKDKWVSSTKGFCGIQKMKEAEPKNPRGRPPLDQNKKKCKYDATNETWVSTKKNGGSCGSKNKAEDDKVVKKNLKTKEKEAKKKAKEKEAKEKAKEKEAKAKAKEKEAKE